MSNNTPTTSDLFQIFLEYSPQYRSHVTKSYKEYKDTYKQKIKAELKQYPFWSQFTTKLSLASPVLIILLILSSLLVSFGGAYAATKTPFIQDLEVIRGFDNSVINPIEGFFTDIFVDEIDGRNAYDVENVLYQIDQDDSRLVQYTFDPCYLAMTYPRTNGQGQENRGLQFREDGDVNTLIINPEESTNFGKTQVSGGDFSISCSRTEALYEQGGVAEYPPETILSLLPGWGINPAHVSEVLIDTFESREFQTVFHFRLTQTNYKVVIPHAPGTTLLQDISGSFAEKVIFNYPTEGDEWFKSRRRLGDSYSYETKTANETVTDVGCGAKYRFASPNTSISKYVQDRFYYGIDNKGPQTLVPNHQRSFSLFDMENRIGNSLGDLVCNENTKYLYTILFDKTVLEEADELTDTSEISFLEPLFDETTKVYVFDSKYEDKWIRRIYRFANKEKIYFYMNFIETDSLVGPDLGFEGYVEFEKL